MPETVTEATLALKAVSIELEFARQKFPRFNSAHEGYAVILEELEELKTEVFKRQSARSTQRMREEAIQVAAMALRFVVDLCNEEFNDA